MSIFPAAALLAAVALAFSAQDPKPAPVSTGGVVERAAAGDSSASPGPLATDLSPALTHKDITAAMRKVASWQVRTREPLFNQQWTFAALYDGLLAYSAESGDPLGHDAVVRTAEKFHWQLLDTRFPHADDEAIGQAYLNLYAEHPDPVRLAHTKLIMDRLIARPDDSKPVWWWCDALFMAPPVLVRLAKITGDHKYIDYMNREWRITQALLYNPTEHLYFRDDRFLDLPKQHEANGKPIFWSRGDGWVVAGLVSILEYLPSTDPARPAYETQFTAMLTRIAALQPEDGLWRTGLLDPGAYKNPEVSGSAFFTFAMAYGINHGLLDRATFTPVVTKSWSAMVAHIYADGRLGSIQPIGFAPDKFDPASSYVYGVGSFLLAGSELDKMLTRATPKATPPGSAKPHN